MLSNVETYSDVVLYFTTIYNTQSNFSWLTGQDDDIDIHQMVDPPLFKQQSPLMYLSFGHDGQTFGLSSTTVACSLNFIERLTCAAFMIDVSDYSSRLQCEEWSIKRILRLDGLSWIMAGWLKKPNNKSALVVAYFAVSLRFESHEPLLVLSFYFFVIIFMMFPFNRPYNQTNVFISYQISGGGKLLTFAIVTVNMKANWSRTPSIKIISNNSQGFIVSKDHVFKKRDST